jgi:hypothetical protein
MLFYPQKEAPNSLRWLLLYVHSVLAGCLAKSNLAWQSTRMLVLLAQA